MVIRTTEALLLPLLLLLLVTRSSTDIRTRRFVTQCGRNMGSTQAALVEEPAESRVACVALCDAHSLCQAVDYRAESGRCRLLQEADLECLLQENVQGASSMRMVSVCPPTGGVEP